MFTLKMHNRTLHSISSSVCAGIMIIAGSAPPSLPKSPEASLTAVDDLLLQLENTLEIILTKDNGQRVFSCGLDSLDRFLKSRLFPT